MLFRSNEAIKIHPENPEFYWIKGIISMMAAGTDDKGGYLEEAIKAFGVAIARNENEPKYLASRANAYAQSKNVAMALNDMDSAIALAPDNADFAGQKTRIENLAA